MIAALDRRYHKGSDDPGRLRWAITSRMKKLEHLLQASAADHVTSRDKASKLADQPIALL